MTLLTTQKEEKEDGDLGILRQVQGIHEQLLDTLDYDEMESLSADPEGLRKYLRNEIELLLKKKKVLGADESQETLIEEVIDEVVGFGPIEKLLRDKGVTDIFVNSPDIIFIEKKGRVERSSIRFLDNDHVYRLVQRIASKTGKHLDLGTPYFDAQLPDGSRLHAIIPPVALEGIKVSIRKHTHKKLVIDDLVKGGSLTPQMSEFLKIAVRSRFNIVICGGTGSGKTTMLNSLLPSVRSGERMITIEDVPELEPSHSHMVRLVTRAPNPEGKGGVSQADLMINALRMRPDRVLLGELRGPEAFNLLHAMNTGQDGSMVTLHASGTEEVVARLLNMILMARYALSADAVREQITSALDIVVHVSRLVDGSRRVLAISQISSEHKDQGCVQDIFRYRIDKISSEEVSGEHEFLDPPIPKSFLNKLTTSGLKNDYLDLLGKSTG